MSLEIGSIVEGVVTGITNYGAFVKLPEGNTGLIHISEVADAYVENVRNYLNEKDKVKVKILGVNKKGKYDLSLKQALADLPPEEKSTAVTTPDETPRQPPEERSYPKSKHFSKPRKERFEDMMSRFLKDSEERLLDLKRNKESKRGKGRK